MTMNMPMPQIGGAVADSDAPDAARCWLSQHGIDTSNLTIQIAHYRTLKDERVFVFDAPPQTGRYSRQRRTDLLWQVSQLVLSKEPAIS